MIQEERATVSDELERGIKAGVHGARTAARFAKAASKAAAGDISSAAMEVLKEDKWRKTILAIALAGAFLTYCIFFMAPLSLYEGIQGASHSVAAYWDTLREQWRIGLYEGDGGPFRRFIEAVTGLGNITESIQDISAGTEDKVTEDDLRLFGDESAMKATYKRKLDAVRLKMKARSEELKNAIPTDDIAAVMESRFHAEEEHLYDGDDLTNILYDGTNVMVSTGGIGASQCLQLLCLYSAQIHTSLDNVRLSGLLKWLGYKGATANTLLYAVGDTGLSASIRSWKGSFMPQYLMDEASERGMMDEYTDSFGCSVCDFLLYVTCPDLYSIDAVHSEEIKQESRQRTIGKDYVYKEYNDPVRPILNSDGSLAVLQGPYHAEWSNEYRMTIAVRDSDAPTGVYYINRHYTVWVVEEYLTDVTYIHVKYTVPIHILCRSLSDMTELAGLWEGWLPSEAPYELFGGGAG